MWASKTSPQPFVPARVVYSVVWYAAAVEAKNNPAWGFCLGTLGLFVRKTVFYSQPLRSDGRAGCCLIMLICQQFQRA